MSSEPEKPIEKMLRRWSNERRKRAGDSWEVHPATRRLWHQEVARRFGRKTQSEGSWFSRLLAVSWLRPAGALTGIAVLIIAGWVFLSGPRTNPQKSPSASPIAGGATEAPSMQLAANDKTASGEPKDQPHADDAKELPAANTPAAFEHEKTPALKFETAKATSASPESRLDQDRVADLSVSGNGATKNEQQSPLVAASSPAPAPLQNTVAPQRYGLGRGPQPGEIATSSQSAAAPLTYSAKESSMAKKSAPAGSVLRSDLSGTPATNVVQYGLFTASQQFNTRARDVAQLNRRAFNAPAAPARAQQSQFANSILVSFRVEQAGGELRVIDSDNSIYTGPIQETNLMAGAAIQVSPALTDASETLKRKTDAALPQQIPNQSLGAVFKVIGTNRTSNQRVVFSGFLTGNTNASVVTAALQNQNAGLGGGLANSAATNQGIQNLRLNGTALIDGGQEIQIDAVPVSK